MRLNPSKMRIVGVFIDNPDKEFYLSQINKMTGISLDRTHAYLNFWNGLGVISYRKIGRMKMYKLKKSKLTRAIINLLEVLDE